MNVNTTIMLDELYRIFNAINAEYFNGELPDVFIVLGKGKSKNKNYYGMFSTEAWAHNDGKEADENGNEQFITSNPKHEISMSAEYFTRPVANWCATLCHEMVHLYCNVNNVIDTSNKGVYHNKKFKIEAEKRGLIIEKADTIGWSVTTPTVDFINFINTLNIDENAFSYFRDTKLAPSETTPKKRYICPMCATKVQAKKEKNIWCGDCSLRMDYVDITDSYNPDFLEEYNNGLATREGWASVYEENTNEDEDENE